jgi:hypothetical protein
MVQRGRVSAAALEIVPKVFDRVERLRPPAELTDEETEVWAGVVNTQPADWLSPGAAPLLAQYCRHVVQAKRIAGLLDQATQDPTLGVKDYDRLLRLQQRESLVLALLATKMRLSQQSTTNHRGNKRPTAARKPWES